MVSAPGQSLKAFIGLTLLCVIASSAFAALSPKLEEWGKGPAQWIMTSDEQRAWRKVKTDEEANHFIDLFWARRDPSPGTPVNEFKDEFNARVAYADKTFIEKNKRGALTDRGRVYIVLGAATRIAGQTNDQMGVADTAKGARDIWVWERADAQKFDMSRVEVVFVEDPSTDRHQRDPGRTDFGRANSVAIRKAIASADLTEVPAWALTGGVDPVTPTPKTQPPGTPSAIPAAPEATEKTPAAAEIDEPAVAGSGAPPLSHLTLLRSGSIDARSATDPFAAAHSDTVFKNRDDATWTVQFCASKPEVPALTFQVLIAGPLDGTSTDRVTREKELKPVRMASRPGCYILRGPLPFSTLAAGRYTLTVLIDESATGESYDIKQEFRIE